MRGNSLPRVISLKIPYPRDCFYFKCLHKKIVNAGDKSARKKKLDLSFVPWCLFINNLPRFEREKGSWCGETKHNKLPTLKRICESVSSIKWKCFSERRPGRVEHSRNERARFGFPFLFSPWHHDLLKERDDVHREIGEPK